MFKFKKILIIPTTLMASVIIISTAVSCNNNNDNNNHLVTLHPGDGHTINGKDKYSFRVKEDVEYEPTPDAKTGSSFIGWYKNPQLTGDKVVFPLKINENIDLYADYNLFYKSFAVTFNTNGGTEVPTYYVNEGDNIPKDPVTTKTDCTFVGWFDNAELSGDKVTFPYKPSQNTTLYAKWNEIDKGGTLILHTNGGTAPSGNFEEVIGESYVYKTKDLTKSILVAPSTTQESKEFVGWYTTSTFEEGSKVTSFPVTVNKDENLKWYANWKDKTIGHDVNLYDKDSKLIRTISNTSYIAYAPEAPNVEGYKFKEWVYEDKTAVTFPLENITEDKKIYATYNEITECTITLKDYGENSINKTVKVPKGKKINSPFEYDGIYKDYGTFNGWKNGTEFIKYPFTIPESDTFTLTADVTINSAIINIYNSEDNKLIKSLGNIKKLSSQPKVSIGERPDDYVLSYLSTTKDESGKISYPFNVADNVSKIGENHEIKLYAMWDQSKRYYDITLKYDDGFDDYVIKHKQGSISPDSFHIVTQEDKKISGWKDEKGNKVTSSFTIDKDRTFTAIWEVSKTTLKVNRVDDTGTIIKTDEYNHMPISLLLSNVPKTTKSCFELKGYKIKGEEGQPTHGLDKTITLNTDGSTEITEVFSRNATKLTIKYNDETLKITGINDRIISEQSLSCDLSTLPIETYLDYKITGFKYKDTTHNLNETITLDSSETNEIIAVWTKTAFTVTFKYNDGTTNEYNLEHVNKLTSDNIPTLTRSGYRLVGYSKEKDGEVINLINKEVTEDLTYYAKWVSESVQFTVTFHLGSLQSTAKFDDTTITGRSYSITSEKSLSYDECPKCSCNGCAFLGWYLSENDDTKPMYPLSTTQTLYARWAPLSGYITVCLNLSDTGYFKETGSSSTLLTLEKNETTWAEAKKSIPTVEFGDAFKVDHWVDSNKKTIVDTDTFSDNTYLYSVTAEDIQTASSFTGDNWPTFCSIAEQGLSKLQTTYSSEYSAQGNTFVGLTRKLKYRDEEFEVRVVGQKQDYCTSSSSKKATLTFEFTKSISYETWDVKTYSSCQIRTKLDIGGDIYNGLQTSLTAKGTHIIQAKKYSYDKGSNTSFNCYLFLPSAYEIGLSTPTYTNKFVYKYYDGASDDKRKKEYSNIGFCSYWNRDTDSAGNGDPYFIDANGKSGDYPSAVEVSRGVGPMFCIGKAES